MTFPSPNSASKMDLDMIVGMIDDVTYIQPKGTTLTMCILRLQNGCEVQGKSNVIDPANYHAELGKRAAYDNARNQIWELEGYALKRAKTDLVLRAARAAHEANRLYCASLGDMSQPEWEDAPDWQKNSAVMGAKAILENPDQTPEQSHRSWMQEKSRTGWSWGSKKDPEKKLHPCMVPYEQLPEEQRKKDEIFTTIVKAILF